MPVTKVKQPTRLRKEVSEPKQTDDIALRLALMQPSKELLEYYRQKVTDLDTEHETVLRKLDSFTQTCEEQHKLQWEMRQREDEIQELQKALSDMQVYLFQEREQVLRLYAENDRLKIKELEDRKKMAHLLQISGVSDSEVTYFLKEPPNQGVIPQRLPGQTGSAHVSRAAQAIPEALKKTVSALQHEAVLRECDSLKLQLQSLQGQLAEHAKLSKEEINALMEDRRIRTEELERERDRDQDKIKSLTDKLKKSQELLQDSTQDFLEQRKSFKQAEKAWIQEKARLLQELEIRKSRYAAPSERERVRSAVAASLAIPVVSWETAEKDNQVQELQQQVKTLDYQLEQQTKLSDMYREQVVKLEEEVSVLRDEKDTHADLFKDKASKVAGRLQLMNQRYAELERRRNLEVEGFKTDVKMLRQKLRGVEKQLYKVTLSQGDRLTIPGADQVDLAILKEVHQTCARSKNLSDELKHLKAMMYGMENELKHL